MKRGAITLSILTLLGSVVAATAISIFTAVQYVNSAIAPVQAQAEQTAIIEGENHNDIQWIKAALQSHGFSVPADPPIK